MPKANRKTGGGLDRDLDAVLAHDGLHHLHLGADEGNRFVGRTRDLLFVAFSESDAYLVGVYPHGAWGRRDLLERIVRNWPGAGLLMTFAGVSKLSEDHSDDDRWKMMKAGVTVLIEIEGAVYSGPGQTTARTPVDVTRRANAFMWELRQLRETGTADYVRKRGADAGAYWATSSA